MGIKLSAKERVLKMTYVATFEVMSEKELARRKMKTRKDMAVAEEVVRKHKGEWKSAQGNFRKERIILEAINQAQLG